MDNAYFLEIELSNDNDLVFDTDLPDTNNIYFDSETVQSPFPIWFNETRIVDMQINNSTVLEIWFNETRIF